MNPTIDLLKAHRSIRQFQNRRIQPDLFEDLIKAGKIRHLGLSDAT